MTQHLEPENILKFTSQNFPRILQEYRENDKTSVHIAIAENDRELIIAHGKHTAIFTREQREDVVALLSMIPDSRRAQIILEAINKYWRE
jgi:hypothetical protein